MSHASRRWLRLTAIAAALSLGACASASGPSDPYAGQRGSYGTRSYGVDPQYGSPGYIVVDPHAQRLERQQAEEREDLEEQQNDERRALKKEQEQERQALEQADEWDKQDRRAQEEERNQQKRAFKKQDRELEKEQDEDWQRY